MPARPFVPSDRAAQSPGDPRTKRLVSASLWALLMWGVVSGAVGAVSGAGSWATVWSSVLVSSLSAVGALGGQWLARSGRVQVAARFLIVLLYVSFTAVVVVWDTPVFLLYGLLVLTAGLLLGREMAILTAALSIVTGLCVADLRAGWVVPALPAAGVALRWVEEVLALGWVAWLVSLEVEGQAGVGRAGQRGSMPRSRHAESDSRSQLEQLQRRNQYLQAAASLSPETAGVIAEDELMSRCADSIRSQLSFSRVCIYLIEANGERLRQVALAELGNGVGMSRASHRADPSILARRALRSGSPVLGTDAVSSIDDRSAPSGAQCAAALPLRMDGGVVGVLDLYDPEGSGFDRDDVAALQLLANRVAASIRWARAASRLRTRAGQAGVEGERSAADEWRRAMQAYRQLAVVRNDRGLVQVNDAWRPGMSTAVTSGQVSFEDPGRMAVVVPVRVRDQVIAVISARKPGNAAPWVEREVALLQAICAQVGQALENARLYEAVQRREERERLLGQATARMRESLDVQTVLQVAADEIRHALGLAALEVRLEMDGEADG
jgi:GAF domain-containing protein